MKQSEKIVCKQAVNKENRIPKTDKIRQSYEIK